MTDKYEFVLHFEKMALEQWQFDEQMTLIYHHSLLYLTRGNADEPHHAA